MVPGKLTGWMRGTVVAVTALAIGLAAPAGAQPRGDVDFQDLSRRDTERQVSRAATPRTSEEIASHVQVKAQLIPMGNEFVVLALDVSNDNAASAILFDQAEVVLVDGSGTEQQNDPLHPLLNSRARATLYRKTAGTYYGSFHTIANVIHAGASDHFVGTWRAGKFAKGRISFYYYNPVGDDVAVSKDFELGSH